MKLATLRRNGATVAVRVDADTAATIIDGYADLSALLADPDWKTVAANASGDVVRLEGADYAPVVPHPGKIICVGLNYANHIQEMGRDLPEYPTLFAKFKEALTGPYDDVIVPSYAAAQLDWEGELAFVVGRQAYQVPEADAEQYIAGYSVMNDYTMRDYQYRTLQWDQGKTFEKTSGFGPFLTTTDSYTFGGTLETKLEGQVVQSTTTDDLVFTPARLVEYISHIVTLQPGDVVITGTPGGVGHARKPGLYIQDGQTVEVTIEGLGTVRNTTIVK
ncbi:fumarylacetoacetate hydrolase family protein [Rhodococcus opacus]|uniref:Fumarylacetoacetate hydrolase family protein n=1 Tax=Rhodococcus opacus TaxID=37919 RepID=A0AAX3YVF9_RHOOP|nr:fumarylacetoacetate hydrolase family protein [Rhodococcus opacus]MCZ4590172.1 fumarylacetoacetate hydrolase family protein [Rhodococcus opacus]WLF52208.1 fumarylacetoacetate hydrolase family protein [Rhodococcus opacus]